MPLADESADVSGFFELFIDGDVVRREESFVRRVKVIGEVQARGTLAGHEGGSRRQTWRIGTEPVGEANSPSGDGIDVGRRMAVVPVTTQVVRTQRVEIEH